MFSFLLRPAVLAAAPALATPTAAVLLPALAYVLTRRRVELHLRVIEVGGLI